MSLFKWSTPERRRENRNLPIIPNEIYFHIFEHIAPTAGRLMPEQLETFTRLSRVCRFFANCCLPRIFEFVDFSGDVFRDRPRTHRASRGSMLCAQIATKQPLALALVKVVRVCIFTRWRLDDAGSWAVWLFVNKYLAGMSYMKNIRELRFHSSFVGADHWNAIGILESLEELVFHDCRFLRGSGEVGPEKRVKVPRLEAIDCDGVVELVAAIDTRHLVALVVDFLSFYRFEDALGSAFRELRLCVHRRLIQHAHTNIMHDVLTKVPRSLESLWLLVGSGLPGAGLMFQALFADPACKASSFRSLVLRVLADKGSDSSIYVESSPWKDVGLLTKQQLTALLDHPISQDISLDDVRCTLRGVDSSSSLDHVDIYGYVFRLVEGKWSEEPRRTP